MPCAQYIRRAIKNAYSLMSLVIGLILWTKRSLSIAKRSVENVYSNVSCTSVENVWLVH